MFGFLDRPETPEINHYLSNASMFIKTLLSIQAIIKTVLN